MTDLPDELKADLRDHTWEDVQMLAQVCPIVAACLRTGAASGWTRERTLIEISWHLARQNLSLVDQNLELKMRDTTTPLVIPRGGGRG